jgi:hypothetical protein
MMENDWASQVTTWRFERKWNRNEVVASHLPIAQADKAYTAREGVIPGNEAEG